MISSMTKRTYIFDFFGVICSEVAPFWLARYFSDSEAATLKDGLVGAADRGAISQKEMFRRLAALANIPQRQAEDEWFEYVNVDERMVEFVRQQRSQHQIALLTNSPAPFVRSIIDRAALAPLFDHIVVSSEHGVAKPDAEVFLLTLDLLGVPAQQAVMIDDNPRNVAGARALGMEAIHFESLAALSDALGELDDK